MAPEFFPFLFIPFLAGMIVVFVLAAIFVEWPRRILGFLFAFVLKHLRAILIALIPMLIMHVSGPVRE